jgi:hypothetical protein
MLTVQCTITGCVKPRLCRDWCDPHYRRWRRHGDPLGGRHYRTDCRVDGCENRHSAKDLCAMHYERWTRHGDPEWTPAEVDEIAVERAVRGDRPDRLTVAEREQVVRRLHRVRLSDGRIADHLDIGATAVQQIRTRLDLPAVVPPASRRRAA